MLKGITMSKKNLIPPLIVESYSDPTSMVFLSIIEYKKENHLIIIDNIYNNEISGYVLDNAEAENLNAHDILSVAIRWYYRSSERYPLSVEFSKLGLSKAMAPLVKTFNVNHVSRLVGKCFVYDTHRKPKVKRKKVTPLPSGVEIKLKKKDNIIPFKK